MSVAQMFPKTVEEFMEEYKMVDEDHVYSNGIEYVPIFRMKQWFEHISFVHSKLENNSQKLDTENGELISRQDAIDLVESFYKIDKSVLKIMVFKLKQLPSVPRKGEWIEHDDNWANVYYECSVCKEPFVLIDGTPAENLYNFCPNCGCRMKEGDSE